ncbi:hypothetical protein L7F22_011369 [Adiantum nelumboides]|nr:hypothetical protein [Adiantum nelumboides]
MEGEADEAAMGSGISSISSIDSDELIDDSADMVEAVQVLLQGLGEDIHRVGLVKTPLRVARAFSFATKGYRQAAKDIVGDALFPEAGVEVGSGFAGGLGGMVVIRSIDQYSLCGSCLLPFKVCCHIAYISSGYQVVGLSKLARVTDMFARRLQNPQTLADQICQGLSDTINPIGVAVVLQSWHLPVPGCHNDFGSPESVFQQPTISVAGIGQFEDKSSGAWAYFLALLRLEGISISSSGFSECVSSAKKGWCLCAKLDLDVTEDDHLNLGLPYINGHSVHSNGSFKYSLDTNGRSNHSPHLSCLLSKGPGEKFSAMVAAVEVIMEVLVGGTLKEDLRSTAKRYARWLLHFKRGCQESRDNGCMNGMSKSMNGHSFSMKLVKSDSMGCAYDSVVLTQLDAPFCSLCEHHLLPFFGKAHVGYLSSEAGCEGVDRKTVLEIVEELGHKLQVQERLTKEIAEAVAHRFNLSSIIVVLEACHVCLVSRGVEKRGSSTATDAVLGHFATDFAAKADFLEKILHCRKIERTSY